MFDEAEASIRVRAIPLPEEVREVEKRIKFIVHRMKGAVENHEFEKARFYSDEERKERENLRLLREKHNLGQPIPATVTRDHIEQVVSRTGGSIASIRLALARS